MVSMGKTYGTLMIDVSATNEKLRERAVRIVQEITSVSRSDALEALAAADGRVTVAAVMLARGVSASVASGMLEAAGGRLRAVLEEDA